MTLVCLSVPYMLTVIYCSKRKKETIELTGGDWEGGIYVCFCFFFFFLFTPVIFSRIKIYLDLKGAKNK